MNPIDENVHTVGHWLLTGIGASLKGVSDPKRRARRGQVAKNVNLTLRSPHVRLIEGASLVVGF